MPELTGKYEWIKHLDVVLTFAVIAGHTIDEVVRIYGGTQPNLGS